MWEHNRRYRFKVVPGQVQVERIGQNGTLRVQVLVECTFGSELGQRGRYGGYLNSQANQESTVAELRVMGWKGTRLGDWKFGDVEFEATMFREDGNDGKNYWRVSFPRSFQVLKETERTATDDDLAVLNAMMGDMLTRPVDSGRLGPPPSNADADEFPPR